MKILFFCFLIFLICIGYIRLSKVNIDVWHVDPDLILSNKSHNSFLLNAKNKKLQHFDLPIQLLYKKFNRIIIEDGCSQTFGELSTGLITYECRSKLFGFPDYVSIKFEYIDELTSSIAIYSRSRFGRSDLGKNRARIVKWLKVLRTEV